MELQKYVKIFVMCVQSRCSLGEISGKKTLLEIRNVVSTIYFFTIISKYHFFILNIAFSNCLKMKYIYIFSPFWRHKHCCFKLLANEIHYYFFHFRWYTPIGWKKWPYKPILPKFIFQRFWNNTLYHHNYVYLYLQWIYFT